MKIFLILLVSIIVTIFMGTTCLTIFDPDQKVWVKISMLIGGFIFYNVLMLSINKDDYDDTGKHFPIMEYADKTWDNWFLNFVGALLLLVAGQEIFHVISMTENIELKWSDGWYPANGFIVQIALDKWKERRKKKSA
jgi:SNF family Na+-dependent transporter